ncbi:Hypothetical protein I595_1019 [Croceitalea dokdonensis DOKDO 023]|uniref:tRNA modification GTPase n=1 Tax=Croceitalea dokdonensis DOKDO 023 TaxID=1300341 RepID=A0A0P7B2R1_9FLAO|nr:hypothetical protein [Croceitalea dokdonensis]KPM32598.1 Hypothetical protein I595_1019 [Croceitalea dokdonensis DOKDO 023]
MHTTYFTTVFVFFMCLSLTAQLQFKKGYFVDNTGQRTDCMVKGFRSDHMADIIVYKKDEDSDVTEKILKSSIKELAIHDGPKYIRETVELALNSESTTDGIPKYKAVNLVLRVLLESDEGNLFSYKPKGAKEIYFFKSKLSDGIKQLVYFEYSANQRSVQKNNEYKNQLIQLVYCEAISLKEYEQVAYDQKELLLFFEKYNECQGKPSKIYSSKDVGRGFNLKLLLGTSFANFKADQPDSDRADVSYVLKPNVSLGIEGEYFFSGLKNKWSFISTLNYEEFTSLTENTPKDDDVATLDLGSNISAGLAGRHYFYFNKKNTLFFELGLRLNNFNNAFLTFEKRLGSPVQNHIGIHFGTGVEMNRVGLRAHFFTAQSSLPVGLWDTSYTGINLSLSYRLWD